MTTRDIAKPLILTATALALILAGPATAGEGGGATVEEVIEYCKGKASLADLLPMVHPDDQSILGLDMVMAGIFAPVFAIDDNASLEEQEVEYAKLEAEFEAILKKHAVKELPEDAPPGDTEENFAIQAGIRFEGVDIAAFLDDAGDWMAGVIPEEMGSRMVPDFSLVEDLQVEGDGATATIDGRPVEFHRQGGRWYLRLEL